MLHRRLLLSLACGSLLTGCSNDGDDGTGAATTSTTSPATTTTTSSTQATTEPTPTTSSPGDTSTSTAPGTTTSTSTGTTTGTVMPTTDTTSSSSDGTSTSSSSGADDTGTTTASASTGATDESSSSGGPVSKCVATAPTMPPGDCAAVGIFLQPPYDDDYECYDLGPLPDVPQQWGGLIIDRDDPNVLLAGGLANTAAGALYAVGIARDPDCHIQGYTGTPTTLYGPAEYNDGGLTYHPDGGPLFISRWPVNELGQLKPGDVVTNKVIDLDPFAVASSPGGVTFVPPGFAGEGQLKFVSWSGGQWYTIDLAPDGNGTYDIIKATLDTTIVGGPEAFVYVSDENPEFAQDGLLVAEWSAGNIAAYTADNKGTPILNTRKDFITGLDGAESAYIDPQSGDFLFATFSGQERLVVIRGFVPQPQ